MITANELIKIAELKGLKYEEHFPCSKLWMGNKKLYFDGERYYTIGINLYKNVWYWWTAFTLSIDMEMELCFTERYNQANGHQIKSFRCGFEAEQKIKELLSKN